MIITQTSGFAVRTYRLELGLFNKAPRPHTIFGSLHHYRGMEEFISCTRTRLRRYHRALDATPGKGTLKVFLSCTRFYVFWLGRDAPCESK